MAERQAASGLAWEDMGGVVEDEPGIKSMVHKTTRSWVRSGNNEEAEAFASGTARSGMALWVFKIIFQMV